MAVNSYVNLSEWRFYMFIVSHKLTYIKIGVAKGVHSFTVTRCIHLSQCLVFVWLELRVKQVICTPVWKLQPIIGQYWLNTVFLSLQAGVLLATQNDWLGRKNGGGWHHSLSRGQTTLQRTGVFQRTESVARQWLDDRQILSSPGRPHR